MLRPQRLSYQGFVQSLHALRSYGKRANPKDRGTDACRCWEAAELLSSQRPCFCFVICDEDVIPCGRFSFPFAFRRGNRWKIFFDLGEVSFVDTVLIRDSYCLNRDDGVSGTHDSVDPGESLGYRQKTERKCVDLRILQNTSKQLQIDLSFPHVGISRGNERSSAGEQRRGARSEASQARTNFLKILPVYAPHPDIGAFDIVR
ncbi:hypothetical protein EI94DRAFT_1725032 [Lactarius quietus]|nr:hypothetical protein EI94DRAFT_1725032 [Lactarius quietus]